MLDLDDAESFRVFARVSTFADEKRRLVFFLLDHASLTEGDPVTLEVLTKVATDEPFDADHIVTTLIESQPGDVITYDLVWSYIDQDDLRNRSWDDFLGSYGLDGVIQGRIDARCLLSPVEPPRELEEVIQEMRLCFAFGQLTAVHALCRTLLETALTDLCLRLGHISKKELNSEFFFKDYPPARRIQAVTPSRSEDREEAFRLYKGASKIIHGTDQPKGTGEVAARTIRLVERLYRRHANRLRT